MRNKIFTLLAILPGMVGLVYSVGAVAETRYVNIGPQRVMSAQEKKVEQEKAAQKAAKQAARDAEIANEAEKLGGAHRTNEARKLIEMREKAAAARSKNGAVRQAAADATRQEQQLAKQKQSEAENEALRVRTAHFQKITDDLAKKRDGESQAATAKSDRKKDAIKKPKKKLIQYPEAVMVCTHPVGPKGKFRCANPLSSVNGHLQNITGWRTPQEMVVSFSAACPAPRPLHSSTHLVWGCGFAATGLNNARDTGQGIAISGRRSYFCSQKEASCRRTSPE